MSSDNKHPREHKDVVLPTQQPVNPGDNPNLHGKPRKKYRPRNTNTPRLQSDKPSVTQVDPRAIPISIQTEVRDEIATGSNQVGSFEFRPECVQDLLHLTHEMIASRFGYLSNRTNIPEPEVNGSSYADVIVNFVVATQLYETLSIDHTEGAIYKLKALKYQEMEVPSFLVSLAQSLGSFKTNEGTVRMKAIEQYALNYGIQSIGHAAIVNGNPIQNLDLNGFYVTNSVTYRDDVTHIMKQPLQIQDLHLKSGQGADEIQIPLDPERVDLAQLLAFNAMNGFNVDQNFLDYYFIKEHSYAQVNADNALLARMALIGIFFDHRFSDRWVAENMNVYHPFKTIYGNYASQMFKAEKFAPSSMGTTAQFVVPDKISGNGDVLSGKHEHPISRTEASVGLLLVPSANLDFSPKYQTSSVYSRKQMFTEYARQFERTD